jgi:hypothetical protein
METILANVRGRARSTTLEGREYRVAPATIIVPGVLNGSKGALYYPPDEVQKNPGAWNGVPVVVYHPQVNGLHVSASDPAVPSEVRVGFLRNDRFENGRRRADVYFDVQAVRNYDSKLQAQGKPMILPRVERGEHIELSTGLFTDNQEKKGSDRGRPYTHVALNYRPDHLAILPDERGACSIQDGCGVFNSKTSMADEVIALTGDVALTSAMLDDGLHHHFVSTHPEDSANKLAKKQRSDGLDPKVGDEAGLWSVMVAMAGEEHMFHFLPDSGPTINADGDAVQTRLVANDWMEGFLEALVENYAADGGQTGPERECECDGAGGTKCDKCVTAEDEATTANKYTFDGEDCPECGASMEGDPDSGVCNQCGHKWGTPVANAHPNQPKSLNTGKYKALGAGTGKGDVHQAAQAGFIALTDRDLELGRAASGTDLTKPDWVGDEKKWTRAREAATKGGYQADQYWAVAAHIYQRLGGDVITNAFCATGEGGGVDPTCPPGGGGGDSPRAGYDGSGSSKSKVSGSSGGKPGQAVKVTKIKPGNKILYRGEAYEVDRVEEKHGGIKLHFKDGTSTGVMLKSTSLAFNQMSSSTGETDMNKAQLVSWLTTNCDCWKGADKVLNTMEDDQLKKLKVNAEKAHEDAVVVNAVRSKLKAAGATDDDLTANEMPAFIEEKIEDKKKAKPAAGSADGENPEPEEDEEVTMEDDVPKPTGNRKVTLKQMLANASPEEKAVWDTAVRINNEAKKSLVRRLVANVQNPEVRKKLVANHMKKTVEQLELEVQAIPTANVSRDDDGETPSLFFPAFAGEFVGNRRGSSQGTDETDILDLPTVNQEEWVKQANLPKRQVA